MLMGTKIQNKYRRTFFLILIYIIFCTTYNIGIAFSTTEESDPYQWKDLLISVSGDADSNVWIYVYREELDEKYFEFVEDPYKPKLLYETKIKSKNLFSLQNILLKTDNETFLAGVNDAIEKYSIDSIDDDLSYDDEWTVLESRFELNESANYIMAFNQIEDNLDTEEYKFKVYIEYYYTLDQTSTNEETWDYTGPFPSGAISISGTLEDKEYIEYDITLTSNDLLEIYIEISTSSVDIKIIVGGKVMKNWDDVSNQFNKKLAGTKDDTYTLRIENPGTFSGGDELIVQGYYLVTPNAADQAQILLSSESSDSSESTPWIISLVELFLISIIFVSIRKQRKK